MNFIFTCGQCGERLRRHVCPDCEGKGLKRRWIFSYSDCTTCETLGYVVACDEHHEISAPLGVEDPIFLEILSVLSNGKPITWDKLAKRLNLPLPEARYLLMQHITKQLIADGVIRSIKNTRYQITDTGQRALTEASPS